MTWTAAKIRRTFVDFFVERGHRHIRSSPLIPGSDPTLFFTNSGMVQFKDVFVGARQTEHPRATTVQKCLRVSGKHNDLENVGRTARHHTFFEMLGNFSFGDYFKKDAIRYAWELLTEVFKLPAEKLWVTVYAEDDEAYDIWHKTVGVPAERIVRIGDNKGARYASDNFWMMGDTGPCGPCTEIFYDHGPEVAGGPPGSPGEDGDRYIEIWNNVFMQFNRDEAGVMHKLPKPSVDTGMGLERLAAVLQHVHSNYEIDLFVNLLAAARQAVDAAGAAGCDKDSPSLKVIADHIRACAFTVADGVIPGNEGRGYVLRRIARRAIRHGYKLGARKPFFHTLVGPLADEMGDAYPELRRDRQRIVEVLKVEEERFFQTIAHGMEILESALAGGAQRIDGETAFKLHDTFGFPLDLTADVCRERGVTVDSAGFEVAMNRQREQARAAGKFKMAQGLEYDGAATAFHGYEHLVCDHSKVTAIYIDGSPVPRARAGDDVVVVLDHTPFYAESGGQVGDTGTIRTETGLIDVDDTFKPTPDLFVHRGTVAEGFVRTGEAAGAEIDAGRRQAIRRNHTATHLLHRALRIVVGEEARQAGSLVAPDRLRFDFTSLEAVTPDQLRRVAEIVNREILRDTPVETEVRPYKEAVAGGAMALFGEKYGDTVRVVGVPGFSQELCGGTHVGRIGEIGPFLVVAEGSVAAGIRRVEAVTGTAAVERMLGQGRVLDDGARALRTTWGELPVAIDALQERARGLERELEKLRGQLAGARVGDLVDLAVAVDGTRVLAARIDADSKDALRQIGDRLRDQLGSGVVVLGSVIDGRPSLLSMVTPDVVQRGVKAGDLVRETAVLIGGKGGGRPDHAEAGGRDAAGLDDALASVRGIVQRTLGGD